MFLVPLVETQAARFLFDGGHAQSAGNADWVIDADAHNISWNSSGTFTTGGTGDSNPQRIPNPTESNIVAGTSETYWVGSLSSWAVDLVKRGHSVETLSPGRRFTFGTTNVDDLAHYNVVVSDEPNILFTLAEKQALLGFVAAGGGLFMISDHVNSDRNGDGVDSVEIWNDFLTNNGLTNNPFGITFATSGAGTNHSGASAFRRTVAGDPIIFGPAGIVTNIFYSGGNEFALSPAANPTVLSHVWFSAAGSSNTLCGVASCQYGQGRVVICGDSSPFDDGTGDPNDTLFDGYRDASADHRAMILNASEWLATFPPTVAVTAVTIEGNSIRITWDTAAGKSNYVQVATPANGSYTNAFTNLTAAIVPAGSTTNHLDIGGATNQPARYYRIRLVP